MILEDAAIHHDQESGLFGARGGDVDADFRPDFVFHTGTRCADAAPF